MAIPLDEKPAGCLCDWEDVGTFAEPDLIELVVPDLGCQMHRQEFMRWQSAQTTRRS